MIALIPGQQRSLDKLKATRQKLAEEVAELINDFGPRLYADFSEVRPRLIYSTALSTRFSHAFWCLRLVYLLLLVPPVYGGERVAVEP